MKNRKEITGSKNDNWETPDYVLDFVKKEIFNGLSYFDPCPLSEKIGEKYILKFNGLEIDWGKRNYINPPYNITDKPKFVKKCYDEYNKGNVCVLLIPATTETNWFHKYIVPYAKIYLIKKRIMFKGFNSKNEYVTNKTGQSGSMLCVFDKNRTPSITTLEFKNN